MRSRVLASLLALSVLGGAAVAAPAHAAVIPPPVEISAPTGAYGVQHLDNYNSGLQMGTNVAERFVATGSGDLRSLSLRDVWVSDTNVTAQIFAADQFSVGVSAEGLTSQPGTVFYAGTPLGSTTLTRTTSNGYMPTATVQFDNPGTMTAGKTYWIYFSATTIFQVGGLTEYLFGEPTPTGDFFIETGYPYRFQFSMNINLKHDPIGVTLTPATPDGAHGWYTGSVSAAYTCDVEVVACPPAATFDTEGDHVPSGTLVKSNDLSNFAWFHHVRLDTAPPTITGTSAPTGTGFTVTWTCDDATSGIDVCPAPTHVSGLPGHTTATATATDEAGNSALGTVTGLVAAKHAPTLVIKGVTPNKTYAYGTKVTPSCVATSTRPSGTATCTGTTTKKANTNRSVTWTYRATATDADPLGGTTTKSVSWTIAAKPVVRFEVHGLPKATKNGHTVIDHRKSYDLWFTFRDANGKVLTGKPTWLYSVQTNSAGTKGTPTKKMNDFFKASGHWTMDFDPAYSYAGQYRKFGVVAPTGKRHYVTIYVK